MTRKKKKGTNLTALYVVGEWAGQPQHRCTLCAYDTLLGEQVMLQHLVSAHNSLAALERVVALEETQPKTPAKMIQAAEPDPDDHSHVVAIVEMSDDDLKQLLNEGEDDGTNKPD